MSLISPDAPESHAVDGPDGRLGGAPELEAIHEPVAAPDLVPKQILQRAAPETAAARTRRRIRSGLSTVALHGAFAAAFFALLTWHPTPVTDAPETPVEVEISLDKPQPKVEQPTPEPPKPEAPKSVADLVPQPPPPPAPAPDPHPPAPPAVQPSPSGTPAPSALLAPPPEPARARTQTQKADTPNDAPDAPEPPKATHEATPAEAREVLATANPNASFAVPKPESPKPQPPSPKPVPAAPKAPSETDKLAAVLPTDTSGLPDSFRAVLSGNGAAVDAAYKGLVYGRFGHAAEIGERARQQHLKGQVIVAFSIDDDGGLKNLSVLQSSGNPAVDALGLEMVRSAAPFPPPPPGAQHSFTPAFAFGD